ncbi:2-succinyl-6-hydroxy-2,4-cyclohexadiene-1-carboxylate synthase [soil metagenome]
MIGYLHGFLGSPAVWGEVDGACVALPGHGGGLVASTWDDNLAAIADMLGPCEAIVGYSLGARVAIGLVVAGHVPRAVLISGNPGIAHADRPARRASDARWAAMVRTEGVPAFLDAWEAQPLFATQARASELALRARRARRLALDPEQIARSLEAMGLAEMPDYRAEIDDRFRLIVGAEDLTYVAIARSLPAPLEVVPECGHDALLEQPVLLAAAVERALT